MMMIVILTLMTSDFRVGIFTVLITTNTDNDLNVIEYCTASSSKLV